MGGRGRQVMSFAAPDFGLQQTRVADCLFDTVGHLKEGKAFSIHPEYRWFKYAGNLCMYACKANLRLRS